jgi:putative transposase
MLPKEYGKCKTVYWYFNEWSKDETWKTINDKLTGEYRLLEGREEQPILAIVDSQSVKTTQKRLSMKGFDGGKKIGGVKRHLAVDIMGNVSLGHLRL